MPDSSFVPHLDTRSSRGEQRFNSRCSTFPMRTLLAQRTRCCRVENWNPEEPSHKLQRVKVERKEEDGMELAWEVSPRPNQGLIDGGEALFIAKPLLTLLLIVGENV